MSICRGEDHAADYTSGVLAWFEQVCRQQPDHLAIEAPGKTISYRTLEDQVGQLVLGIQANGTKLGAPVAVLLQDRADLVATMLGIFQAGCVFVPLDDGWPTERLRAIVSEVAPELFVVCSGLEPKLEKIRESLPGACKILPLWGSANLEEGLKGSASVASEPESISASTPSVARDPDALRYIYYTSGSTGRPKGIAGRLKGLNHFVHWEITNFNLRPGCRVSQLTSPTFDAFFRDTLVPLCAGGTICIPPRNPAAMEIDELVDWIDQHQIEMIHCVPSLFNAILAGKLVPEGFPFLKYVLLSGEALQVSVVKRWRAVFQDRVQLVNLYGATETTMVKLFHRIEEVDLDRGFIPIGKPIDGAEALILDEQGQECPRGEPGEIYIRTPYRTLGYFKNLEATEAVFVQNPSGADPNDILYKSGDLALLTEFGTFQFLGRKDHQVKIRGIRVELDEIRSAIMTHEGVVDCAVVMRNRHQGRSNLIAKDGAHQVDSREEDALRIVAYVVYDQNSRPADLRRMLERVLPDYMIPSRFIQMESLPINSNGKVDLKVLPEPDRIRPEISESYVAPERPHEATIAGIWEEVLGIEGIGANDSFFELGGDSLSGLQVINTLRKIDELDISISDLFECQTIAKLAERVKAAPPRQSSKIIPTRPSRAPSVYPLSLAQQGIWFLWKMEPASAYYTAQGAVYLKGDLNLQAFRQAWSALIDRHEVLRASFPVMDGKPVQRFLEMPVADVPFSDLAHLDEADRERAIHDKGASWLDQPFDLEAGSLVRFHLFRIADREHKLLLTIHEITIDLWSVRVLLRDLKDLYEGFLRGERQLPQPLEVKFSDYVLWEAQAITRNCLKASEDYWRRQLAGTLPVLEIPRERPRPASPTYRGQTKDVMLDADLSRQLREFGRRHNSTLFMTLLSAFKVLLHVYSNQNDLIIGAPLANRNAWAKENLVGFFLNMLPLRTKFESHTTFVRLLGHVRKIVAGAMAHADYPFLWMLEWADAARDPRFSPVFQAMFNMLSFSDSSLPGADLEISYRGLETGQTKYDLALYAQEHGDRIHLQLAYQTDLFEEITAERMLKNLTTLLRDVLRRPEVPLAELEWLHPDERQFLLGDVNQTKTDFRNLDCIQVLFEQQVERTPNESAYFWDGRFLTYRELNSRANQLAYYLLRLNVGPGTLVAVCTERSFDQIVALLGIIKAGGTYVPLDADYPALRLRACLEDTKPPVLVLHGKLDQFEDFSGTKVYLDRDWERIDAEPESNPECLTTPDSLLKVVYTSSTTGKSKGVLVPMRAVLNRLGWMWEAWPFQAGDRAVLQKSYALVAAIWEIFGGLLKGIPTVILSRDQVLDPGLCWKTLVKHQVSYLLASPSLLRGVLDQAQRHSGERSSLRLATTSAEPISPAMVAEWKECFPEVPLLNLYGLTECSSNVTVYDTTCLLSDAQRVPVGKPLSNARVYVLNDRLRPVPIGVTGELCVGGACLARGYLNLPDLDATHFVSDPFSVGSGERLYRTGDLARVRVDGNIELMGRSDFQVKIRGFRVDLGEIEAVLRRHELVNECAVAIHSDETEEKFLVAYVVVTELFSVSPLLAFLRDRLPDYMIPSFVIELNSLPATPNGKLDRKALPDPDRIRPELSETYAAPRNDIERIITEVWQEALRLNIIGVDDNFFDLGGHSMLLVQVHGQLQDTLEQEFPLVRMFEYPTVSTLAEHFAQMDAGASTAEVVDSRSEKLSQGKNRVQRLRQQRNQRGRKANV